MLLCELAGLLDMISDVRHLLDVVYDTVAPVIGQQQV